MSALTLYGETVGSVGTCIIVPQLGIAFDAGFVHNREAADLFVGKAHMVFVSHGHGDHVGGLAQHWKRRLVQRMKPKPTYVLPPRAVAHVKQWASLSRALDHSDEEATPPASDADYPFEVVEAVVGSAMDIPSKNKFVRAFPMTHTTIRESFGYVVYEQRTATKAEYAGLAGADYKRLRREGIEFTERVDVPILAFTGDTTIAGVLACPDMLRARVLLIECTFFQDEPVQKAHEGGHIHIEDLREHQYAFAAVGRIVLIHPSNRYVNTPQVQEFVDEMTDLKPEFRSRLRVFRNGCVH